MHPKPPTRGHLLNFAGSLWHKSTDGAIPRINMEWRILTGGGGEAVLVVGVALH